MTIKAKYALLTAGLIGVLVAAIAGTVTAAQRRILETDARERLEALMEGVGLIAQEAVGKRDHLMLLSALMVLRKEHPELITASVTYRGHTSQLGADRPGLLYLTRTAAVRRPVTYTVQAYASGGAAGAGVSVSTAGVTLTTEGDATVSIQESRLPETLTVQAGFDTALLTAGLERALQPLFRRTLQIAVAFMALGMLGAWSLAQLLTGPLTALSRAASCVGRGELDVAVPAAGRDEVGLLAREFNAMIARLKELMDFREDVLHTLTHELNTPLAGLKGYLGLWQERRLPQTEAEQREVVDSMMSAVLRMEGCLGNALRLFRPGALAMRRLVAVHGIFHEVSLLFAPVARSKGISLRAQTPQAASYLFTDEESLRQVVSNLLSNALKYTPDGGRVSFGIEDAPEQTAFWVTDTGYGIPAEDLPHLFTKFFRSGPRGAAGRIPGSGLGLAIAKKAVDGMGGTIRVTSEPGLGSTFFVAIPKAPLSPRGTKP